jgi:hypothetical protein
MASRPSATRPTKTLFLSVKTANLSRIYRQLGIASRRQLARLVNGEPG